MEARYVPERMYIRMPRDTALALSECAEAYFDMDVRSMAVILVEEALLSRGFLESDQIRVIMSVSSESIEEVVGLLKSGQRGAEEPGRGARKNRAENPPCPL